MLLKRGLRVETLFLGYVIRKSEEGVVLGTNSLGIRIRTQYGMNDNSLVSSRVKWNAVGGGYPFCINRTIHLPSMQCQSEFDCFRIGLEDLLVNKSAIFLIFHMVVLQKDRLANLRNMH